MAGFRSGKIMEFVSEIFEKFRGKGRNTAASASWCRDWKSPDIAPPVQNKQLSGFLLQAKKRLGLFSPRRLGSPPPELPNHPSILGLWLFNVNVTLVMELCASCGN
jgi:hypothetical protein